MHDARSAPIKAQQKGCAVCDCCGLLAPRAQLLPWMRRMQCREFAVQDPARRSNRRPEEEWISGPFRHFHVIHEHQVCHACFDHLLDGGEFASAFRHRGKLGFLILGAVVIATIVLLPLMLPVLQSALWLAQGEN